MQRLLTVNSLRKAQRSLWLNWPILTALSLTTSFAGISMYSRYANCDPLLEKRIRSPDQVITHYLTSHFDKLYSFFKNPILVATLLRRGYNGTHARCSWLVHSGHL